MCTCKMDCSGRKRLAFFCILVPIPFLVEILSQGRLSKTVIDGMKLGYLNPLVQRSGCPGDASGMSKGRWLSRPLTKREEKEVEAYQNAVRSRHELPKDMQRKDGKCGNVTYSFWFRALCNPKGSTPCCFQNKCVQKSIDECRCHNCWDLRTGIHAEYATWETEDPRCDVKNFTSDEVCRLLNQTRIVVVGDSMMRQLYIGLLMIMANYNHDLVFTKKASKEIRANCSGMHIYGRKECMWAMNRGGWFCNSNTQINLLYFYALKHTKSFHKHVQDAINGTTKLGKTIFLVSIGIHVGFQKSIYEKFLLPAIEMTKKVSNVKIVWATNHRFGVLKSLNVKTQFNDRVEEFNNYMMEKIRPHDIPVLDTYNLTNGVSTPDGVHFGQGINLMKARMLLNLIKHMYDNGMW